MRTHQGACGSLGATRLTARLDLDVIWTFLSKQHELWTAAGIKVTQVSVGDSYGAKTKDKLNELFS